MKNKIEEIRVASLNKLKEINDIKTLEEYKVEMLGKKGVISSLMKGMKDIPKEEKPEFGQLVNDLRVSFESNFEDKKDAFKEDMLKARIKLETIDVTMPGKKKDVGHRHPMSIVIEDIENIFLGMGYEVAEGPEIEQDYYNFKALNIPDNHPARDEQDTFYFNSEFLLRTQTSSVQVRVMENKDVPIKIIAPGRVYRSDEVDATHTPVFHQLEGLVVDENITMSNLKGALEVFAKELLGEDIQVRFRPHHFPFTEPSAEMDVTCFACKGEGCRTCKGEGWIELLGCGMVHPKVLDMCGVDSKKYSGFAFGMGLERIAMQKYGITDLRLMYENDDRFINQFR
ncbi:MAG: phenylalanine--tRNA ligase subunit alpha [Lachnospirales bacterium]